MNRLMLKDQGVDIVVRDTHKKIKNQLRLLIKNRSNHSETQKLILEYIESKQQEGIQKIVISDENLLDVPASVYFEKTGKARFYPKGFKNVKKLDKVFENYDVTWLLYTREQHSLIPSLYKDGLKYFRYSDSLDAFCNSIDVEEFNFKKLVNRFRRIVASSKVITRNYETIKQGTEFFILNFFNTFAEVTTVKNLQDKVNTSLGSFQTEMFRLFAKNDWTKEERNSVKEWIKQAPNINTFVGQSNQILSKEQETKIKKLFANDISYSSKND